MYWIRNISQGLWFITTLMLPMSQWFSNIMSTMATNIVHFQVNHVLAAGVINELSFERYGNDLRCATFEPVLCIIDIIGTFHYIDVIMTMMASQITSLTVVNSIVYSDANQGIHQSSASLAFVWGTGEFPTQRASYAENVSIWWRHHVWNCLHVNFTKSILWYCNIDTGNGLVPTFSRPMLT